jgi:hypothetical protein
MDEAPDPKTRATHVREGELKRRSTTLNRARTTVGHGWRAGRGGGQRTGRRVDADQVGRLRSPHESAATERSRNPSLPAAMLLAVGA